jgi:hypothetical protein
MEESKELYDVFDITDLCGKKVNRSTIKIEVLPLDDDFWK